MSKQMTDKLSGLLVELSQSNKSYSAVAGELQKSLSAEREAITLPDSVLALMGASAVPDIVAYEQSDLLRIIDVLARTIGYTLALKNDDIAEDGMLLDYITKYRSQYALASGAEITDLSNVDVFAPLNPIQRQGLAIALLDLAVDRKLSPPPLWQTIIDNHGKLGGE